MTRIAWISSGTGIEITKTILMSSLDSFGVKAIKPIKNEQTKIYSIHYGYNSYGFARKLRPTSSY